MSWLDSITSSMDINLSELWETVKDGGAWHAAVRGGVGGGVLQKVRYDLATKQQQLRQ